VVDTPSLMKKNTPGAFLRVGDSALDQLVSPSSPI